MSIMRVMYGHIRHYCKNEKYIFVRKTGDLFLFSSPSAVLLSRVPLFLIEKGKPVCVFV